MEWSGVMPAITTKFSNDDKLDLDLFNKNLDFQLQAGIHAIVLGGSCLLYTSPSPRDTRSSRMPSSA